METLRSIVRTVVACKETGSIVLSKFFVCNANDYVCIMVCITDDWFVIIIIITGTLTKIVRGCKVVSSDQHARR